MSEQITKADSYQASVDEARNRWYRLMKRRRERTFQLPDFPRDYDEAIGALTPGYDAHRRDTTGRTVLRTLDAG
jgi:hypothetical protein